MATFYLTFGEQWRREPHPQLGARPELPDGYLTVEAEGMWTAYETVFAVLGISDWQIYFPEHFPADDFPAGHLGSLQQALAHHRG